MGGERIERVFVFGFVRNPHTRLFLGWNYPLALRKQYEVIGRGECLDGISKRSFLRDVLAHTDLVNLDIDYFRPQTFF